jgi:hypothetical protein
MFTGKYKQQEYTHANEVNKLPAHVGQLFKGNEMPGKLYMLSDV